MLKFNCFGTELWPATLSVRIEAGVSYRTVQRHIDDLVDRKVLAEVYPANSNIRGRGFRRSATYKLNSSALIPRLTWREWKDSQPSVVPIRPEPPQKANSSPAPPTPIRSSKTPRKLRQLTPRERQKLVNLTLSLMHGYTEHVGQFDGIRSKLDRSDPRYKKPMEQSAAMLEACKQLAIPIESAVEALKLAGWTMEEGEA